MNYRQAHNRVKRLWGSASQYPCAGNCGKLAAHWAYDGTDRDDLISYSHNNCRYSPWPEFYMPLCARCHRRFDMEWHTRIRLPVIPKEKPRGPRTEAEWDDWLKTRKVSCAE